MWSVSVYYNSLFPSPCFVLPVSWGDLILSNFWQRRQGRYTTCVWMYGSASKCWKVANYQKQWRLSGTGKWREWLFALFRRCIELPRRIAFPTCHTFEAISFFFCRSIHLIWKELLEYIGCQVNVLLCQKQERWGSIKIWHKPIFYAWVTSSEHNLKLQLLGYFQTAVIFYQKLFMRGIKQT